MRVFKTKYDFIIKKTEVKQKNSLITGSNFCNVVLLHIIITEMWDVYLSYLLICSFNSLYTERDFEAICSLKCISCGFLFGLLEPSQNHRSSCMPLTLTGMLSATLSTKAEALANH